MRLCEKCKNFIAEDALEAKALSLASNLTEEDKKELEGSKNWLCHKCLNELLEQDIIELFSKINKTDKKHKTNKDGQFENKESDRIMGFILALQGVVAMLEENNFQSSNRKELRDIILGKLDYGDSII